MAKLKHGLCTTKWPLLLLRAIFCIPRTFFMARLKCTVPAGTESRERAAVLQSSVWFRVVSGYASGCLAGSVAELRADLDCLIEWGSLARSPVARAACFWKPGYVLCRTLTRRGCRYGRHGRRVVDHCNLCCGEGFLLCEQSYLWPDEVVWSFWWHYCSPPYIHGRSHAGCSVTLESTTWRCY